MNTQLRQIEDVTGQNVTAPRGGRTVFPYGSSLPFDLTTPARTGRTGRYGSFHAGAVLEHDAGNGACWLPVRLWTGDRAGVSCMNTTARPRPTKGYEFDGGKVSGEAAKRFNLANTEVVLEPGPAGTIARIERPEWVEYAGPLPKQTIEALAEVAE